MPFYNMGTSIRYHELQSYFHGLRRKMGAEHMLIEDFVDDLLEDPGVSEEIEEKGTRYQQLTIRARRVMQQKYKVLKDTFFVKPKSRILCLPGTTTWTWYTCSRHRPAPPLVPPRHPQDLRLRRR